MRGQGQFGDPGLHGEQGVLCCAAEAVAELWEDVTVSTHFLVNTKKPKRNRLEKLLSHRARIWCTKFLP